MPDGTELIELRSKALVPVAEGRIVITPIELGILRYSLVPPSPYQRQTLTLAVTGTKPVSVDQVDAVTARRIEARHPIIDQINALRGDGDVDFAWIDAVRDAGRKLKAMTPIPADFADDHHWPA